MNLRLCTLLLAAVFAAPSLMYAQQPMPVPGQQPVPVMPDLATSFASLTDQPATHTAFAFDRTMLQIAQNLLASGGMDANAAAAALTAISVDNYRYPQPAFYTPETMNAIIDTFHAAGWKHLVNANQTAASTAQPHAPVTDLWIHFSGPDINGVTVLTRSPRDMNVVHISCELRPLDLLHLSGHFGIPKVDPNAVMVPAPNGR